MPPKHSTWLNPTMKQFDVVEIKGLGYLVYVILEELQNDQAKVAPLTLEGTIFEAEAVVFPISNLKLCDRSPWKAAAQVFRQTLLQTEISELTESKKKKKKKKRRNKTIKLLSDKFNLSPDEIKFIYKAMKEA